MTPDIVTVNTKRSKKTLVWVLLTAAFGVSTEFLVRQFGHLPSSFRDWQQKPHWKNKPEFAGHVCSVCECTRWSNGGTLVLFVPCCLFAVPEKEVQSSFSAPPTPYIMHQHTQSSFQTAQAGKQDGGRRGGVSRQTPACVLTFRSPSISHPVAPLLRQQCWTC